MYKITLIKDGQEADITSLVGEMTISESMDTVGASLSFSVPDIEERYVPRLMIMAGDIVKIESDGEELMRAVVVNVTRSYPKRTVKAYDFGFYLNKNDIVIQFKDSGISEALRKLFGELDISVGEICDMPAKADGVYIKNVSEIIKELIKIQQDNDGKEYYYELRGDKIYVFQLTDEPIDYIFKPAVNVAAFDVTESDAHGRGKYTHSIEDMKNSVRAFVNSKEKENLPAKEVTAKDEESIKKYGLLSENYSVNSEDAENLEEAAKNRLKEKDRLKRELSMDFIGHDKARPGRVMHIKDEYLGIDDLFRIKSVNHKINGSLHTMSCVLDFVKESSQSITTGEVTTREDISAGEALSDGSFKALYASLSAQVGKPYVWGAQGPESFDCSGLVHYCFNESGAKSIGRMTAQGYYDISKRVSANNRKPGDLVFWAKGGKVYHVGVYVGDGYMINAENESVGVRKTKLWSDVYAYGRL